MIIKIYSKPDCQYCDRAKALFKEIDWEPVNVSEYVLGVNLTREEVVTAITENCPIGTKITVPQIWVDGVYIGGFDKFSEWFKKESFEIIRTRARHWA
jgi:glutaredoxin